MTVLRPHDHRLFLAPFPRHRCAAMDNPAAIKISKLIKNSAWHPFASDGSTNKKDHAGQDEVGQNGDNAQPVGKQAPTMKVLAMYEQGVGVGDGAEDEPLADEIEVVGREGAPGLEGRDGDQDGIGDVPPVLGRVLLMVAFMTLAEDLMAFDGVDE
ncbi:hypothetical protein NEUTE1DRAFT_105112 [Neurospora tetrasperma FGSC 2508]|uniref:Uncharacterized protein n=1 Tax=Neurospora tetrasperma (strain FGSC 2508 / ATCC MYA-4615 / P0657) TaxID=510951 RepID=F8N085_NEUT8|nr:uncharacterized protein NEUTE1DRAFT_105112 [Neurospora tetrasperma FGSC 2508]EGO52116.1 hypothetical protein NEUTE1DRAFT_105112 [Neurospora tetrasperma FGSC 2508]